MPRMRKRWPDEVFHSPTTIANMSKTAKEQVANKTRNLTRMSTCEVCGVTMQENMHLRWHGPKCDMLNYIWDYKSPKLTKK